MNGWVTATSVDGWYRTLAKPAFNPPDWVCPPAWNLLFPLWVAFAILLNGAIVARNGAAP